MMLSAFLRRDWQIRSRYRLAILTSLGRVVFTLASFFFIGKLVDPAGSPTLAAYGGAYFPFVVFGLAWSRYLTTSLYSLSNNLRDEQLQGTLEALLTSPAGLVTVILGTMAWEWVWATVEVGLLLGVSVGVFGVDLGRMDLLASLVIWLISVVCLSALGVVTASGILLFKEFDPFSWLLEGLMKLTSGVYVPVALLPGALQAVAQWLPLTYALEGFRQAMLRGRSLQELRDFWMPLGICALVLWPLALIGFSWTLKRLKTTGALSFR